MSIRLVVKAPGVRQPLSTTRRPENDRFLEILIATRKETRVSQRELARRLGKTQSYVSKVESGQQRMDVLELVDYCRAIGAPASLIVLKLEAVYDERVVRSQMREATRALRP